MEARWRFFEYKGAAARRGAVSEWLATAGPEIADELSDMLDYLSVTGTWRRPEFDAVENGVKEIRWKSPALGVQVRVYGIFGPRTRCFTMLVGSTKKGRTHDPKDAKATAQKRKRTLEGDWSLVREFET